MKMEKYWVSDFNRTLLSLTLSRSPPQGSSWTRAGLRAEKKSFVSFMIQTNKRQNPACSSFAGRRAGMMKRWEGRMSNWA